MQISFIDIWPASAKLIPPVIHLVNVLVSSLAPLTDKTSHLTPSALLPSFSLQLLTHLRCPSKLLYCWCDSWFLNVGNIERNVRVSVCLPFCLLRVCCVCVDIWWQSRKGKAWGSWCVVRLDTLHLQCKLAICLVRINKYFWPISHLLFWSALVRKLKGFMANSELECLSSVYRGNGTDYSCRCCEGHLGALSGQRASEGEKPLEIDVVVVKSL